MGRAMNKPAVMPISAAAWRVAALTMMDGKTLAEALSGEDAGLWVEAAAACGIAEAQLRLGRMLLEGEGVPKNAKAAFACFQAATQSGDAEAHNMLGRAYENGWGVAADAKVAALHYQLAADQGLDWADYNLGHLYLNGLGVMRDAARAFAHYARAAGNGHPRAMSLMGRCLENGWGVDADAAAARDWYRQSAEGGYFRGAYNFAHILAGEGDIAGAAHWFSFALEKAWEPSLSIMIKALSSRPEPELRALARLRG